MSYSNVLVHKLMLEDKLRTENFRRAIEHVVKPSDQVIDFGCGTGILSFFASKAGAGKIYAIDKSKFIRVAKKISENNGYENIKFFYGEESEFQLSEKVDVIISEWMGHFVFYERMFEPLVNLRDRFLKNGGKMVPAEIFLHAGLVCDPGIYEELTFFKEQPYGIDFMFLEDWSFNQIYIKQLTHNQICEPTIPLARLDMISADKIPSLRGSAILKNPITVYAICGWFDARLAGDIYIKTGPLDPKTHWHQILFPMPEPLEISTGEEVTVTIKPVIYPEEKGVLWAWNLTTTSKSYKMSDILYNAWTKRDLERGWLEDEL